MCSKEYAWKKQDSATHCRQDMSTFKLIQAAALTNFAANVSSAQLGIAAEMLMIGWLHRLDTDKFLVGHLTKIQNRL